MMWKQFPFPNVLPQAQSWPWSGIFKRVKPVVERQSTGFRNPQIDSILQKAIGTCPEVVIIE